MDADTGTPSYLNLSVLAMNLHSVFLVIDYKKVFGFTMSSREAPKTILFKLETLFADKKAENVHAPGDWNNWDLSTAPELSVSPTSSIYRSVELQLTPGLHFFKLYSNGRWSLSPVHPRVFDADGNENSALVVRIPPYAGPNFFKKIDSFLSTLSLLR
jgi:hypothetical protein